MARTLLETPWRCQGYVVFTADVIYMHMATVLASFTPKACLILHFSRAHVHSHAHSAHFAESHAYVHSACLFQVPSQVTHRHPAPLSEQLLALSPLDCAPLFCHCLLLSMCSPLITSTFLPTQTGGWRPGTLPPSSPAACRTQGLCPVGLEGSYCP